MGRFARRADNDGVGNRGCGLHSFNVGRIALAAIIGVAAAELECGKQRDVPGPCTVSVAYGVDLNRAGDGSTLVDFKGTLDYMLNATPLQYSLYKEGLYGWNMDSDYLAQSGLIAPTSRLCYDSNYFCPPGPCAVLDINYLSDIAYRGVEYVRTHTNPANVYGKGFCGPVFGTRLRYTANDTLFPSAANHRQALQKLPGSLPSRVQTYIPSNDVVNDVPAWWYERFEDWEIGDNRKLRKNGKPCNQRIIPDWMLPYNAMNRRKTRTFADEDVSYSPIDMYAANEAASPNAYGSQNDTATYASSSAPDWKPSFTLCDSSLLRGVFLGYTSEGHVLLGKDKLLAGFGASTESVRSVPRDDSVPLTTIVQAVKYYLESYTGNGEVFCLGQSGSRCDFPSFLYSEWANLTALSNVSCPSGDANCAASKNNNAKKLEVASLAMLVGQLFTIVRPCESVRSRQSKLMRATYNDWRRAYYNPGNNRAAFEHAIGCTLESSQSDTSPCRVVRKELEWQSPSACVPIGGCSTVGHDCCSANGAPALQQDSLTKTGAAEFLAYAYSKKTDARPVGMYDQTCSSMLGNESAYDSDSPLGGTLPGGSTWPYSSTHHSHARRLRPFICGIEMGKSVKLHCKHKDKSKDFEEPSDKDRFYAASVCDPDLATYPYAKSYKRHNERTVEDTLLTNYGSGVYDKNNEATMLESCRDYRLLSAVYTFLVNCVHQVVFSASTATSIASFNYTRLESELHADANGTTADSSQQHCGVVGNFKFRTASGKNERGVIDKCTELEQGWDSNKGSFFNMDSASGLTWTTCITRAVHPVRKRYLPRTPLEANKVVTDTSLIGMTPHGHSFSRRSDARKQHTHRGIRKSGVIDRYPQDLKVAQLSAASRFVRYGYIGEESGPADMSSDCSVYFELGTYITIQKAETAYYLYDKSKGIAGVSDGTAAPTDTAVANTEHCGWHSQYIDRLNISGVQWAPGSASTAVTGKTLYPDGYWANATIQPFETSYALDKEVFKNAVSSAEASTAELNKAKARCRELRFLDCIGVQSVFWGKGPTMPFAFEYQLITLSDLLHGQVGLSSQNESFYPVPCYAMKRQDTMFGGCPNPRVRNVSASNPIRPMGTAMWKEPAVTYAGMQESYLLDGLSHYAANARFTVNKSGFVENPYGAGMRGGEDSFMGLSVDFDIHSWVETMETAAQGGQMSLRAFMGSGLAVNHYDGIRHLPKQTSGIRADVAKIFMYTWAGMFDSDGWLLDRRYRFQHPSHLYPDQFVYAPSDFVNVTVNETTYTVTDPFVRSMLEVAFDPTNSAHKDHWNTTFCARVRAAAEATSSALDKSMVTYANAYIDVSGVVRLCEAASGTNDDEDVYGQDAETMNSSEWKAFVDNYEAICDLHVCDIVQHVSPAVAGAHKDVPAPDGQPISFECVPKGYTYFQRGSTPVDVGLQPPTKPFGSASTDIGEHIQSAFGFLGYRLAAAEVAILRTVMIERRRDVTGSAGAAWGEQLNATQFEADLWYACTRFALNNNSMSNLHEVCTNVIAADSARGYPDSPVLGQWNNEDKPPGNVEVNSQRTLPMFFAQQGMQWVETDYSAINVSDLYVEHREAIPVYDMTRSASYSNLEQHNNAVPCDCDNQQIVWMCNRIAMHGSDTPMAENYDFRNDVPQSTYWTTPEEYGESIQPVECGYSWLVPPMRTPKIGLYVPSKIDLFEVYERDIFNGYQHAEINSECAASQGTIKYRPSGPNTTTSAQSQCARHSRMAALLKLCAAEVFSVPMSPRVQKLKDLLFTGRHPVVSGLAAQNDAAELLSEGLITQEEYDALVANIDPTSDHAAPICWQQQNLFVYDSPCMRYPFGVQHTSTLGSNDNVTAQLLNNAVGNRSSFSEGANRKYTDAYRIRTGGWQGYCELEAEASNLDQTTYAALHPDMLKFRYCQNDPLSLVDRQTLCSGVTPHFVMYSWALTDRLVENACNAVSKLCIVIPGYAGSGLVSSIMDSPSMADATGFTFLIMPLHYDIISEYFARRALFEVGNSFGRSLDAHVFDASPAMHARYPPKHPLNISRRETMRFSQADVELDDDDTSFTGLPSTVDAFAVLARVPDKLSVADAVALMTQVTRDINSTCQTSAGSVCKDDDDRRAGTFYMPALTSPASSSHVRPLSYDEVYRPYPTDSVIVDVPKVTVRSAVSGMPLRFDPSPYVSETRHRATCVHFEVGVPHFTLLDAVFNQTACSHLEPSKQVPIVFSGTNVSDARVEAVVMFGPGLDNATVGTGVLALGDDNRVFAAGKTLDIGVLSTRIELQKLDAKFNKVDWDAQRDLYFHVAVAKVVGDVKQHTAPEQQLTNLLQERQSLDNSTVSFDCIGSVCAEDNASMYTCSPGGCRILNVTRATGVFGSYYEGAVFHELPSYTPLYIVAAIILTLLGVVVFVLNCGLLVVGDHIVHRMVGLHPPMSHEATMEHFKHPSSRKSESRASKLKGVIREGTWRVVHPASRRRHFADTGYGVSVQLPSRNFYDVETMARDIRKSVPLPPEVTRSAPELVNKLKSYNAAIAPGGAPPPYTPT